MKTLNIEIKCSKIIPDEIGLFSVKDFKEGEIIIGEDAYDDAVFYSTEEFTLFNIDIQEKIIAFGVGSPNGFYAPTDFNLLSAPWFMNHCCDGNVGFDTNANFIAIKHIKKGEELCYDYGLVESNPNYTLKCKCGAYNCRKVITGNDWKEPSFREKNISIMTPELRNITI